jgi:hypothetical protein
VRLLDQYMKLQKELLTYFGCAGLYPGIEDKSGCHWMIIGDRVVWSPVPFTEESITDGAEIFSNEISRLRIFRTDTYTLVHTDCPMVFQNQMEHTGAVMQTLYVTLW